MLINQQYLQTHAQESFHLIRPNLREVHAQTDPDWNKQIIREWSKSETVPARPLERLTRNDSQSDASWKIPYCLHSD